MAGHGSPKVFGTFDWNTEPLTDKQKTEITKVKPGQEDAYALELYLAGDHVGARYAVYEKYLLLMRK